MQEKVVKKKLDVWNKNLVEQDEYLDNHEKIKAWEDKRGESREYKTKYWRE